MGDDAAPRLRFSVVIPTYNRPRQLERCLESLTRQNFPRRRFEVIVVDDGSSQPLEGRVQPFRDRLRVHLIRQANSGCAAARQMGIDHASGEYLAFTDDDCQPAPDWLTRIDETVRQHPGCAVLGPTVNGAVNDLFAEATQFIVHTLTLAGRDSESCVRFGPTSNVAFPAQLFAAIGGLNPQWRVAGGEDRDLCARWTDAGHRLRYSASVAVAHYHRLQWRSFLRQHFGYGRGAWLFHASKNPPRRFESLSFYRTLLAGPFVAQRFPRAVGLCALVLAAQGANAAGLLTEALRRGKPMKGREGSVSALPATAPGKIR